jgi:endonuclease YncB( thermonuclease family)
VFVTENYHNFKSVLKLNTVNPNLRRHVFLAAVSLLVLTVAACLPQPDSPAPSGRDAVACIPTDQEPQTAKVVHIADGDTITVEMEGERYRVRYIGIDTPELDSTENDLAVQASQLNADLVSGQDVQLYRDTSETDRYDRLLRYVVVGDTFVNYDLVLEGAARAKDYPPDSACKETFSAAQKAAQDAGAGLWLEDDRS